MSAAEPRRAAGRTATRPVLEVGGEGLLEGLRGALAWLEVNQEQVNELNVFPVPDGDTGSNMHLTMRAAVEEAQRSRDPDSAASVMSAAAHGSLLGARGNSGVILSQILRGFAQGLENRDSMDPAIAARALSNAATVAYKAVMKPTEGTILTVVRDAARSAEIAIAGGGDMRQLFSAAVSEAREAVGRTVEQLAVLREAGVVDAGGFGLAVILEGMARSLCEGELDLAPPPRDAGGAPVPRVRTPEQAGDAGPGERRGAAAAAAPAGGFGFCTEFLINGPGLDLELVRSELGGMGESALIVGDADLIRVHVHTADPQGLIAAASERGGLSKLKIEDMTGQHHRVVERAELAHSRLAVVSVAPSNGFREILRSLGADQVVEGGQTMNPSIEDLLRAVEATGAESVIVLPNNGNVILTAEQVDGLAAETSVTVVPTRNLPQGISALLALDRGASLETNRTRMHRAMERIRSVEITRAVRATTVDGLSIREGDVIAITDDHITHSGSDGGEVIEAVLGSLAAAPELVTVYFGAEVTETEAQALVGRLREAHPGVEFELHPGGQEHYPYVLSLE